MKIALLLSNNKWSAPYINIYKKILDNNNINYDILSWNRDLTEEKNELSWSYKSKGSQIHRFFEYYKFSLFIKKKLKDYNYGKLIVFGSVIPIFLSNYLEKYYKNKYIIDLRDLGIEQKCLFRNAFKKAVKNSAFCSVSSVGFINYFPDTNYLISHNFDINQIKNRFNYKISDVSYNQTLNILTIGSIRNFESNSEIIESLQNNDKYKLSFVGEGPSSEDLKIFVSKNHISNVSFNGRYAKHEELNYIRSCDIMNVYMPNVDSHTSLMSNRFYYALLLKKPMIVRANGIQGELVKKYKLGIAINDCNHLDVKIHDFLDHFSKKEFETNCNALLEIFLEDYTTFKSNILEFLNK